MHWWVLFEFNSTWIDQFCICTGNRHCSRYPSRRIKKSFSFILWLMIRNCVVRSQETIRIPREDYLSLFEIQGENCFRLISQGRILWFVWDPKRKSFNFTLDPEGGSFEVILDPNCDHLSCLDWFSLVQHQQFNIWINNSVVQYCN